MAVAEGAQPFEKTGNGRHQVHVAGDGLDDDGGDGIAMPGEQPLDGGEVVVGGEERIRHHGPGHARRGGHADRRGARAGGDEERIGVAVIAPHELHEAVATGGGAGEAKGRHRSLGAGIHQPHHLDGWQSGDDHLRQLYLGQRRSPEGRAAAQGLLDGGDDRRMAVPQDVRAVAADVVDVAAAVLAFEIGALGRADEDGVAAHAAKGADGRVDAAGEDFFGAGEEAAHSAHPAASSFAASRAA